MGEKTPDYYVIVTHGPYTRGQAQNKLWDLEWASRADKEEIRVTVKHGRD